MRSQLVTVAIAAAIGLGSVAFAATTTDGTIKSLDLPKHEIILDNGVTYMLPAGFADPGLKVGDKVAVVWEMKNSVHEAQSVTIRK